MDYAVNLFFILLGFKKAGLTGCMSYESSVLGFVDPVSQEIVLVAITLSLALTCLFVTIALRIYDKFNTYDIREIRKLKG